MTDKVYHFRDQLKIGKEAESKLDAMFSKWYVIAPISLNEERKLHADRTFTRDNGSTFLVEYKTDLMCHKTGNLVVEIVSVDTTGAPGWVYASEAEFLVWDIQGLDTVLVARFDDVRNHVDEWREQYKTVSIPNDGYHTLGILVPISEYKKVCIRQYHRQASTYCQEGD